VAVMLVSGQASDGRLGRFGAVVGSLTEGETAQITRLADSFGKSPRLVWGSPSMFGGLESITVYLEPDIAGGDVQRGRLLRLEADAPPRMPKRSAWRVKDAQSYACVAAPGRRHFELGSEQDIGWPFVIDGELDDATLVSIVGFIRTRPRIPGTRKGAIPRDVADAPISFITRRRDEVIVHLRTGVATGEEVTMVRREGSWLIINHGMWIS